MRRLSSLAVSGPVQVVTRMEIHLPGVRKFADDSMWNYLCDNPKEEDLKSHITRSFMAYFVGGFMEHFPLSIRSQDNQNKLVEDYIPGFYAQHLETPGVVSLYQERFVGFGGLISVGREFHDIHMSWIWGFTQAFLITYEEGFRTVREDLLDSCLIFLADSHKRNYGQPFA